MASENHHDNEETPLLQDSQENGATVNGDAERSKSRKSRKTRKNEGPRRIARKKTKKNEDVVEGIDDYDVEDDGISSSNKGAYCGLAILVCCILASVYIVLRSYRQQTEPVIESNKVKYAQNVLHKLNSKTNYWHLVEKQAKSSSSSSASNNILCESTLLIIRHCEKYGPLTKTSDKKHHCSYIGKERSQFIATTLFGNITTMNTTITTADGDNDDNNGHKNSYPYWPIPDRLMSFTSYRGKKKSRNYREIETLTPLSQKYNLKNKIFMSDKDLASYYFGKLKKGGKLCRNQLTVVSWKHEFIEKLALELGCSAQEGCPDKYPKDSHDQVWELTYNYIKNDDGNGGTWNISALVMAQGFDPLQYSVMVGDYPQGGTRHGGRWFNNTDEL